MVSPCVRRSVTGGLHYLFYGAGKRVAASHSTHQP
jgi:hypothetical protein